MLKITGKTYKLQHPNENMAISKITCLNNYFIQSIGCMLPLQKCDPATHSIANKVLFPTVLKLGELAVKGYTALFIIICFIANSYAQQLIAYTIIKFLLLLFCNAICQLNFGCCCIILLSLLPEIHIERIDIKRGCGV